MHKVNHAWLYGNVKPYFAQKGIVLLRDDMLFIERCLNNIPQSRHKSVLRDYFAIWNTNIAIENIIDSERVNPRYEANTYLRNIAGIKKNE